MTGFVFEQAQFAVSRGAVLPTSFEQKLQGFAPYLPVPDLGDVRVFADVGPVRSALVEQQPVFAAVFDFVSDEGGLRLVVPEVQLHNREHGFLVQWLLSDDLVQVVGKGRL